VSAGPALRVRAEHPCFGGVMGFYEHDSAEIGLPMRFGLYRPPQAARRPVPAVLCLAGLTCTEETFAIKAGAQRVAAELGLALVFPDTSPRGAGVPGEAEAWDFGVGAGFYLDATTPAWAPRYRMHRHVHHELRGLVEAAFPVNGRWSALGHSMGGHGALVLALRHPGAYAMASAFAPICAPSACPWGEKAFTGYLGPDRAAWAAWDACALLRSAGRALLPPIRVDQGLADPFLAAGQLQPEALEAACAAVGQPLEVHRHAGYDHGYWFVQSFVEAHLRAHAGVLG